MPDRTSAHATTSEVERSLCDELQRQSVSHAHRSLHFRVRLASGEEVRYDPSLIVHHGEILFLVEPVASAGESSVEILARFLEQHSPEIVLVVVAPQAIIDTLPPESYDEVYADRDLEAVVRRIREQDPDGMVWPFLKPRRP